MVSPVSARIGFTSTSTTTSARVALCTLTYGVRRNAESAGVQQSAADKYIGRVCITERPDSVETRSRIGEWEADTVIGKQGGAVLVTLAERKRRFSMIIKAENKTAAAVSAAITKAMAPQAANVHTLTYDNGKVFAYHQRVCDALEAQGFFAHPYQSWERGLNENTNGLIRQYLPKGKSFDDLTDHELQIIMDRLNSRPRKCLGFRKPNQVFLQDKSDVTLES